jgi:flagellar hook protein FlgE
MLRSLFAGVTGLTNHQVKLDVIGNNIANINTVGFKSSRVTFREMLTQTIKGASRPSGEGSGGTNPQQIGLGSSIGSIDTDFSQGNMQITGNMTDLAIEGNGFFILSDGTTRYYTRAGAFSMDGSGHMVNPANGYKLQGILADDNGNINQGGGIEDITLPTSLVMPAKATSVLELSGNLDVDSDAQATITRSEALLAVAGGSDDLVSLYDENGVRLNLKEGNQIQIDGTVGGTDVSYTFTVDSSSTMADLVSSIQSTLQSADGGISVSILSNGAIQVTAGSSDIESLSMYVSGNSVFDTAFSFESIAAGTTGTSAHQLRSPATELDLLADLFDYQGRALDISDDILINGDLGGSAIDGQTLLFNPASTTLGDLVAEIRSAFRVTLGDVTVDQYGRVMVIGDVGSSQAISNIDIDQVNGNSIFDNSLNFTEIQEAGDADSHSITNLVYDSLGDVHKLSITFSKHHGENVWDWEATVDGMAQIMDGGSGTVQFGPDGLLSSFSCNSSNGRLIIDPGNGAEIISINLDPGEIGSVDGMIQYDEAFSVRARDIDGQPMGTLETISIDRDGVVNGQFSNGTNRDLAQIAMADLNNPSGMSRVGENLFIESPNSGIPIVVYAGRNARGVISPGELEMSNVDLAGEFTEMVTAQRGFQANARIISVGDQMLAELVNLKK